MRFINKYPGNVRLESFPGYLYSVRTLSDAILEGTGNELRSRGRGTFRVRHLCMFHS